MSLIDRKGNERTLPLSHTLNVCLKRCERVCVVPTGKKQVYLHYDERNQTFAVCIPEGVKFSTTVAERE